MRKPAVGLIGVGLAGTAVAERLIAAGYAPIGYDIDPKRIDALERIGGARAETLTGAAAETVFLSLPTAADAERALFGHGGLHSQPGKLQTVIDATTGDPRVSVHLQKRWAERAVAYLDAPISGSSEQIRRGKAVFMVGSDREAFEAARPLLESVLPTAAYVGGPGSGMKAKLATNLLLGLNRAALAEAVLFAESLGLDRRTFVELAARSPARSGAIDAKGEKMIRGDFAPQSRVRQHLKDLRAILEYGEAAGMRLPFAELHASLLKNLADAGFGGLDTSAVMKAIAALSSNESSRKRAE